MSEPRPVLEIEPEWCSADTLSAIPLTEEFGSSQAESGNGSSPELASESTASVIEELPVSDPITIPQLRSSAKSRSEGTTSRRSKSRQSTNVKGLFAALRSRRARIVATIASVLFVVGLIVLNWRNSGIPKTSDELAEMDLSDFNDDPGFDAPHIGHVSEPQPLGELVNASTIPSADRFSRTESGPRLPPLGLVNHADHVAESSGIQTAGAFGVAPVSANGSRGAWLTGQIEFDSPQLSSGSVTRPSRPWSTR